MINNLKDITKPKILCLMQHAPQESQKEAGAVYPEGEDLQYVKDLITFTYAPTEKEINYRAEKLAEFAKERGYENVSFNGAPYLASPIEKAMSEKGINVMYSYGQTTIEGNIKIYQHEDWIKSDNRDEPLHIVKDENREDSVLNITRFATTAEQAEQNVKDVSAEDKDKISQLLQFNSIPSQQEIRERAMKIAEIAKEYNSDKAMINGVAYLMGPLCEELIKVGIEPVYSYTERRTISEKVEGNITEQEQNSDPVERKDFIRPYESKFDQDPEPTGHDYSR